MKVIMRKLILIERQRQESNQSIWERISLELQNYHHIYGIEEMEIMLYQLSNMIVIDVGGKLDPLIEQHTGLVERDKDRKQFVELLQYVKAMSAMNV